MAENKWSKFGELLLMASAGMSDPTGLVQRMNQIDKDREEEETRKKILDALGEGGSINLDIGNGVSVSSPVSINKPNITPEANPYGIMPTEYTPLQGTLGKNLVGQDPVNKAMQDIQTDIAKKEVGQQQDVLGSKLTSDYNMGLVSENIYDYANLLVDAWNEGGTGDIYRSTLSKLVGGGGIPREFELSNRFPKTSALAGKKFEIIAKAFPMLTQQIGKEGSVRLIESIFNRFGGTVPGTNTPSGNYRDMMEQTMLSMYRTRRAFDTIDMTKYNLKSEAGLEAFANDLYEKASKIKISGKEKDAWENYKKTALEPLDRLNKNKNKSGNIKRILRIRKK